MKFQRGLLSLVFFLSASPAWSQPGDTTLRWADRLLDDEAPFAVITRLENATQSGSILSVLNRLAEAYLINLDYGNAERLLMRGDSLIRRAPPAERAYHELNWSRFEYDQARDEEAFRLATSALGKLNQIKSRGERQEIIRSKCLLQLGKVNLFRRKMEDAFKELTLAETYFRKDSLRFGIKLAQTYYALGLWHKNKGNFEAGVAYYERAVALFRASSSERYYDLGRCYNNMATAFTELGSYAKAKQYHRLALDLKKRHVTDSLSLAISYANIGKFYYDFSNYYRAKENYSHAISLLNVKNPRHLARMAELLNNYGALLIDMDEQKESEQVLRRALELTRTDGKSSGARLSALLSLSGLLILNNNLSAGDKLLDEAALILADSQSTRRDNARWHLQKANLLRVRDELKNAEQEFSSAFAFSQGSKTLLTAEIYQGFGQLRLSSKDFSGARYFYTKAKTILEDQSPTHPQLCAILNLMGETYLLEHKYDSAIALFQQAVGNNLIEPGGTHTEAVFPFELIASCYMLSDTYQQRYRSSGMEGDLEKSVRFADMGLRAIDARRKSLTVTNDQLAFDVRVASLFERAMEAYEEWNKLKPTNENLERTFYISELSKSQALGQSLRESNLRSFSNVPITLQREEERLREEIQAVDMQNLKELKLGEMSDPDLLKEYHDDLERATANYQRLRDSIRQNLPGYYQLKYDKTLVSLSDIQRDVLESNPHTALIQYSAGDTAVYAQVIVKDKQFFYRIEGAPEIRARIIALRNQIKLGLTDELTENGAWLYERLVRPAEGFITASKGNIRQLIIVPDQILCYLPFEALVQPGRQSYLISKYDISYAYSSTLLWQKFMEKKHNRVAASFIGLAPDFTRAVATTTRITRDDEGESTDRFQFEPLTGNKEEVEVIRGNLEKNNIRASVLAGSAATEASFRNLNLKQYDYVHFATHGFVDMDNPQYAGVAFSKNSQSGSFDDILFANEVYEMQFSATLVCLSACDSGIGKLYKGEGMIGLAQAFLFAGAKNLAVSLWKVEDKATSELMIDFYKEIPSRNLSAALSSAKRKMAGSKKYNHPYFWSSFILVGM